MNRYELTYIIDTALEETARKELIEKVSALIAANGGEVEKVDEEPWGKGAKRLSSTCSLISSAKLATICAGTSASVGSSPTTLGFCLASIASIRRSINPPC